MWNQELADFDIELDKMVEKYLTSIRLEVAEILKLAILKNVYLSYTPSSYERTYQLYNQVKFDVKKDGANTTLLVYIDTDNMVYNSAKTKNYVTEAVPYFVNEGHTAHSYTPPADNQFHNYTPPRQYLEQARTLIKQALGIEVEIIKDAPPYVS